MSRRRSLSTDISTDARVAELAAHGSLPCLLYTWAIPHADDSGRLSGDPRQFRLLVCPGLDVSTAEVEAALEQIAQAGLWTRQVVAGRAVLCFPLAAWYRHQSYIPAAKRRVLPSIVADERISPSIAADGRTSPPNPVSPSLSPSPSPSPSLSPTAAVAVHADACACVGDVRARPADGGGNADIAGDGKDAPVAQGQPVERVEPVEPVDAEAWEALGKQVAQACGLTAYQPSALGRVLRRYHAHDPDDLIAEAAKLGDWLARRAGPTGRGRGGRPMEARMEARMEVSVARLDNWLRRWARQVAEEQQGARDGDERADGNDGNDGNERADGDAAEHERGGERPARPARGRGGYGKHASGGPAVGSPEYYRRARQVAATAG